MIKKMLVGILFCLVLVGCGNKVTETELNDINNKISEYFSIENNQYSNLSAHYVDFAKGKVIVELANNTKEEQKWFKKEVVNSKFSSPI